MCDIEVKANVKVKITLTVTEATNNLLNRLGNKLVNGVQLNRGDVVDYLVAKKAEELRMGEKQTLLEAFGGDWERLDEKKTEGE